MVTLTSSRAQNEAIGLLHRLLEHHKAKLGLGPKTSLKPEQFFPVDTRVLVRLLGWKLEEVAMVGNSTDGEEIVAKCVRPEKRIVLLSTLPKEVKRYTIAHEIGHVLLHADIPGCNGGILPRKVSLLGSPRKKPAREDSDIEREAEIFARELLMPKKAVEQHFQKLFGVPEIRTSSAFVAKHVPEASSISASGLRAPDPHAIAADLARYQKPSTPSLIEFFGVSAKAMTRRLIELHLVY